MLKSFIERRHEKPDIEIEVWITGVNVGADGVHWNVNVNGEDDCNAAAEILERAAQVLRQDEEEDFG